LTRNADQDVNRLRLDLNGDGKVDFGDDLQARIDLANDAGAEVLISMHFNGFTEPEPRGTEVYYNPDRTFGARNQRLASLVQDGLYAALSRAGYRDLVYRGVSTATSGPGQQHYFLLGAADAGRIARPTNMPAVIAEPLFLTNPSDAAVARQDSM